MKVCIYGAGAIGGHLAARLVDKGDAEISIIARGPHLDAIRAKGIVLRGGEREFGGRPTAATDDPATLPPQDLVVVTLKAPSQPAIAAPLARLLKPEGSALFIMNGVPWWWNHGLNDDGPLPALDPDGALWRDVGPRRALGGVVRSANTVIEPGVVLDNRSGGGGLWQIGEPDGKQTARAHDAVSLFRAAGLNAHGSADIRGDIWRKLCFNVSSNPIAALTRLSASAAEEVEGLDDIVARAVGETLAVAAAMGWDLRNEIDPNAVARPANRRSSGKSSMLQDVEAGRALEVDAIVAQVKAFGARAGVATPTIDVILPLLRGLDLSLRQARGKQ